MATASAERFTEVQLNTSWRTTLKKEAASAKSFAEEWGFLIEPESPTRPFARSPIKYHSPSGGTTILMKRIPLYARTPEPAAPSAFSLDDSDGGRPRTALESTIMSHSRRVEQIRSSNPCFYTSSSMYGARVPMEQFGVSHHGLRETPVTKWRKTPHFCAYP